MTEESSLCLKGEAQSPIEIISSNTQTCEELCDLKFFYRTSMCTLTNTSKEFRIQYDAGSTVKYKDDVYLLEEISYSRPSSHIIDGKQYDAEMLLYHKNNITKNILVISILLQVESNDITSASKSFLDQFIDYIPTSSYTSKQINLGYDWNIFNLLPEVKSFYTYQGSLLKSPCTENVTWIIMKNPVYASTRFFDTIKRLFPEDNNRGCKDRTNRKCTQPLNNRVVYYNSNTSLENSQNYGSSVKCYDDKSFRSECSLVSKNTMVEKQKNQSLIYIGIILLVIILIIVILILKNKGYFSTLGTSINNSLSSIKQTVSSGMSKVSGKLFKSSNQNNIGQTQLITRGGRR